MTVTADQPTDAGQPTARVFLRNVDYGDRDEFLTMVRQSRELHRPWAYAPERPDQFEEFVARSRRDEVETMLVCRVGDGAIVGVYTISQIVRGMLQSAFVGYYGHARHARRGYIRDGMHLVVGRAFSELALHRLEANIQPGNTASIALATGAGFRLEGYSPRYLLIDGRWRDHERYALTLEERESQNSPS